MKVHSPDVSQGKEATSTFVPQSGLIRKKPLEYNQIKNSTLLLQFNQYIPFYNAEDRKEATAKAQKPPWLLKWKFLNTESERKKVKSRKHT